MCNDCCNGCSDYVVANVEFADGRGDLKCIVLENRCDLNNMYLVQNNQNILLTQQSFAGKTLSSNSGS